MDVIELGGREITVNELNVMDATEVDIDVLISVGSILSVHDLWGKSTYELAIEKPKLFIKLLAYATGEKKKFIKSLKARDYDSLVFVFLSVNAEFFIQRLKLIQLSK